MPLERSTVKGPTEFIAECGGLLGLFMGISLLSFVEIFYYFTIRLLVNLFRHRKDNQQQPSTIAQ
jgi:acid-sensing ion channel, other